MDLAIAGAHRKLLRGPTRGVRLEHPLQLRGELPMPLDDVPRTGQPSRASPRQRGGGSACLERHVVLARGRNHALGRNDFPHTPSRSWLVVALPSSIRTRNCARSSPPEI